MKSFLLIILSCTVLSYALPIFPQKVTEEETELAELYLDSSFPQPEPRSYSRHESNNTSTDKTGPKRKFCGASSMVNLYPNTPVPMKRPRYGFPNIGAYSHFPRSPKWRKRNLTYSIRNYTPDMNSSEVDEAVEIACKIWSAEIPLNFTKVPRNGDIVISFYTKEHKPPFNESVLAYAYGPGPRLGGDIFLNEDVFWTMDNHKTWSEEGVNAVLGITHEMGHGLGLGHSTVHGSVMKEDYTPPAYLYKIIGNYRTLQLHEDDRIGIQALYGPRRKSRPNSRPRN